MAKKKTTTATKGPADPADPADDADLSAALPRLKQAVAALKANATGLPPDRHAAALAACTGIEEVIAHHEGAAAGAGPEAAAAVDWKKLLAALLKLLPLVLGA